MTGALGEGIARLHTLFNKIGRYARAHCLCRAAANNVLLMTGKHICCRRGMHGRPAIHQRALPKALGTRLTSKNNQGAFWETMSS